MSKVPFDKQFSPGDLICSSNFYNRKVMVVEKFNIAYNEYMEVSYTCQDLMVDNQKWRAKNSYNWELASDKDIFNYFLRFIKPAREQISSVIEVSVTEEELSIRYTSLPGIYLDKEEARKLKRYLNKWIID